MNRHQDRTSARQLLAQQRRDGRNAVELLERQPQLLPSLKLGAYPAVGQRHLLVRRASVAMGIQPELLLPLAKLMRRQPRSSSAMSMLLALAYWRGVRSAASDDEFARMTDGIAILMFHGFSTAGSAGSRFVVPVDLFEAQLRGLLRRGHRPLALSAYLEHRADNRFPPPRSFVVTIDDGYAEVEDLAAPVLLRLGVPATLFIVEGRVGMANDWSARPPMAGRRLLDVAAIHRLRDQGLELGVHSATHILLAGLSSGRLADEIVGSTRRLTSRFGPLVASFAYPFGAVDEVAREAVVRAGLTGLGTSEGLACPASSAGELPRIEVKGTDSPLRVALAARLGGTRHLLPAARRAPQP